MDLNAEWTLGFMFQYLIKAQMCVHVDSSPTLGSALCIFLTESRYQEKGAHDVHVPHLFA